ncbi:prion-inhibition and propagation-domain-containing protein [Cladorrhinum sp. PSN332]|nr:prion-inhibition and propagation-domain-containing protein [Cladorrhinum sp. PSN332]
MAEVAGLVLGAVGVVGVIGAFKDAIELFNVIADSRHCGRDFEILDTKLNIEKTLLLQWADRVKLTTQNYDRRLDDYHNQRLVVKILESVAMLFTNAPELQKRYGLEEAHPGVGSDSAVSHQGLANTTGSSRWLNFLNDYMRDRPQRKSSITAAKKLRWVIRDRQKFEALVQELGHFTTKLNEIFPPVTQSLCPPAVLSHPNSTIASASPYTNPLEPPKRCQPESHGVTAPSSDLIRRERCKDYILNKLWFRKMNDRRDGIRAAYSNTLQWVLSRAAGQAAPWDNLSTWLRSGTGIYWVSGKAGSGKSTLMKYIYQSPGLSAFLLQWAAGSPCLIADFFFMALGTAEQKSQEGLFRTLLFQILSRNRDIIPEALPVMWKELDDTGDNNVTVSGDVKLPSTSEMEGAFNYIANSQSSLGRFCFLIDGLDEFTGNYLDAISFINSLVRNPQIKVILSSRPIPDCVAAFSECPKLRLQDLNRPDIALYVNDNIGRHFYMNNLIQRSPVQGREILNDIIIKSSGVFLWVVLACRSLTKGFADYDNISELRRRVDELPPELETMFEHMLRKVEARHREQGACLLRLHFTHHQMALQHGSFLVNKEMYALGLALAYEYYKSPVKIEHLSDEAIHELCVQFEGRLRSRCGGLLEVTTQPSPKDFEEKERARSKLLVSFMHRSVFEFLENDAVWKLDCLRLPQDGLFDPSTGLSLYGLHLAKQDLCQFEDETEGRSASFLWDAFRWAGIADGQPHGNTDLFFHHLSAITEDPKLMVKAKGSPSERLSRLAMEKMSDRLHFGKYLHLRLAVEAGAVNYEVSKHAANTERIWERLLGQITWDYGNLVDVETEKWAKIVKMFLEAGACPRAFNDHRKQWAHRAGDEMVTSEHGKQRSALLRLPPQMPEDSYSNSGEPETSQTAGGGQAEEEEEEEEEIDLEDYEARTGVNESQQQPQMAVSQLSLRYKQM